MFLHNILVNTPKDLLVDVVYKMRFSQQPSKTLSLSVSP